MSPTTALTIALAFVSAGLAGCMADPDVRPVVREFTLEAKQTLVELYPGKAVAMWTFNDRVPGPLIRVREGDLVRIHFHNNHTLPHNVHFHGAHPVGMDGVEEVPPGGHFTYEFVAGPAGAFVYHCHVDTRIHIQKGLYGQFIVDPKDGWNAPRPEREHFAVFNDWNPNLNATSEAYTINGKSFPSTIPFPVELSRTARFFVSSMSMVPVAVHFHGTLSDQIWPNRQAIDVVSLLPGETRVLDYRSDYEGVWMFHDHFEDHLVNDQDYPGGTLGLIQVGRAHWSAADPSGGHHASPAATGAAPQAPSAGDAIVVAKDYKFSPLTMTVKVGTTVAWRNDDPVPHTVTSDAGTPLDSGNFGKGQTFSHLFTKPGTYTYHCLPHSGKAADGQYTGMVGTVIVTA